MRVLDVEEGDMHDGVINMLSKGEVVTLESIL